MVALDELANRVKEFVTGGSIGVVRGTVLGGTTVVVISLMVHELSSMVMVGGCGIVKSSVEVLEVSDPAAGRLLIEGVGIVKPAVEVEELAPES